MDKNTDSLRLVGLRLQCRLGVTAAERRKPQTIVADVALRGNWRKAGMRDKLEESADYAALAADLRNALKNREFCLLEAAAEAIAAVCLRDARVATAEVKAAKKPPVAIKGLERFEVCVQRQRPRRALAEKLNRKTKRA